MAVVPSRETQTESEIDLLPMSWLVERGCSVLCDDTWVITTPKQRAITMAFYEEMPYPTAKQIQLVLDDLPEAIRNGRSGEAAYTSVLAAQVTYTFTKLCRVQWWNQAECDRATEPMKLEFEKNMTVALGIRFPCQYTLPKECLEVLDRTGATGELKDNAQGLPLQVLLVSCELLPYALDEEGGTRVHGREDRAVDWVRPLVLSDLCEELRGRHRL